MANLDQTLLEELLMLQDKLVRENKIRLGIPEYVEKMEDLKRQFKGKSQK